MFLSRFTERPDGVTNLLHLRTATSVIEKLGYTLEERLPPVERPNTRDLSVFAYLQIADNVPSEYLIPLDLNEFNELMNKVVREQFGFVGRNFKTRHIDFERIRDIARTVVRDPTGLLRGAEPETTESSSTPSQTSVIAQLAKNAPSLLPAPGSDIAASYVQGFRTGMMAAKFNVPGIATLQQLESVAAQQQPTPVAIPQPVVPQPESAEQPSQVRIEGFETGFEGEQLFEGHQILAEPEASKQIVFRVFLTNYLTYAQRQFSDIIWPHANILKNRRVRKHENQNALDENLQKKNYPLPQLSLPQRRVPQLLRYQPQHNNFNSSSSRHTRDKQLNKQKF